MSARQTVFQWGDPLIQERNPLEQLSSKKSDKPHVFSLDCCSERAWGNLFLTHHLLLVKEKGAKPFAEKGKPCWILKAWSTLSEKENEDYGQQSFIELFFCFLYFASWRCSLWSPQEMHCSAVLLRPFWWVPLHRSTYRWKLMITRVESHSDVFW